MRESEPLFRHLAEHSLVGIYIIQNDRYVYVNPRFAETFGYTIEEILGLEHWLELIAMDDRHRVSEQVRRRLSGEIQTSRYCFRGLRRDCTIIDVEVYGSTTNLDGQPAAIGNLIDISERLIAKESLRESEELFRRAFEDTELAMVLTDLEHHFVRVNAAFARMFGYEPWEMLGMTTGQVTHPDDRVEIRARRESLLSGRTNHIQMEKQYVRRDGRILTGLTNISLVRNADGNPHLYVSQIQDITQRKRLEEQVSQTQKMEAIGVLAGGIAHDFNNLLTVINGYCELILQDDGLADVSREMVRAIHRAGDQAASLTRQLLAFSRKQVLAPKVLDLNVLVREMVKMLRRLIGADVHLITVLDPNLGRIVGDPGQIEQVVMNLVVNARDAMPRGGKITIETANIKLGREYCRQHLGVRRGQYVRLAVTDTGIGMDAATQARIFEPFFTTKEIGRGTGLGLSTVHGVVKQTGGHVEVYSEPGHGTTLKVYLPVMSEEGHETEFPSAVLEPPRGTETLLMAEDDEAIRTMARTALQSCGYTLLEASNGEEAIRVARNSTFDLLITDVVMPAMSGRELVEQLHAIRPETKVLYISGYTDDAIVRHGIVSEGVAFLHKPFTPTSLARKVREVLDTRVSRMG